MGIMKSQRPHLLESSSIGGAAGEAGQTSRFFVPVPQDWHLPTIRPAFFSVGFEIFGINTAWNARCFKS